ncbi:MAG: hypothetical protein KAH18_03735 [Psychromonas sp.]|nr:hypothetical protein [Psychromonas sp.]
MINVRFQQIKYYGYAATTQFRYNEKLKLKFLVKKVVNLSEYFLDILNETRADRYNSAEFHLVKKLAKKVNDALINKGRDITFVDMRDPREAKEAALWACGEPLETVTERHPIPLCLSGFPAHHLLDDHHYDPGIEIIFPHVSSFSCAYLVYEDDLQTDIIRNALIFSLYSAMVFFVIGAPYMAMQKNCNMPRNMIINNQSQMNYERNLLFNWFGFVIEDEDEEVYHCLPEPTKVGTLYRSNLLERLKLRILSEN